MSPSGLAPLALGVGEVYGHHPMTSQPFTTDTNTWSLSYQGGDFLKKLIGGALESNKIYTTKIDVP